MSSMKFSSGCNSNAKEEPSWRTFSGEREEIEYQRKFLSLKE
ncbi:9660_t:CDS:1, partial [Dentiscutata heterogama]